MSPNRVVPIKEFGEGYMEEVAFELGCDEWF